ncbi:glycosyltransferase family 4 protein [Tannockella kyphosi]|uniref:glycosyltransferase family 4 protein n=1 Tax=Tannockella kyphosi TaxID=2899121 RepID=UPI0020116B3C|nr:glycosyltransferase family 4 protein [Tannockella kyphosi]
MKKRKILIIMGRYLPGYKDGGPVRSIKNLVDYLGDEYDFQILTCDRDHGDDHSYQNIKVNDFNQVGNASVYYVSPKCFTFSVIRKLSNKADMVYVCGCFNDYAINTLILKRFNIIKKPVVVASMGLFSPMEFRLKYKKKKLFTTLFNLMGMFKNIYWSVTSEIEMDEVKKQISVINSNFYIAEDLPRVVDKVIVQKNKVKGVIDIVWISRITAKKNLLQAIEVLKYVKSEVHFTIYGPIHTPEYWDKCLKELDKLPVNISYEYKGNVNSEEVVKTLSNFHIFLFPTLGENYGHVIQEAFSAGCACILSDQTPWQNLEAHQVGFVYPVEDIINFAKSVDYYADMKQEEYNRVANKVVEYAIANSNEKVINTGYRVIFSIGE